MSVVVTKILKDEIVMVADSQVTTWDTVELQKDAKIFQVGELTVGCTGYARDCALLRLFCETHKPKAATSDDILTFLAEFDVWMRGRTNNEVPNSTFHIVFRGRAFYINGYYVKEITDYGSIGSGMFYALGALHAGASPEQAVEAACDLNIYCQRPVNTFRIPKATEDLT